MQVDEKAAIASGRIEIAGGVLDRTAEKWKQDLRRSRTEKVSAKWTREIDGMQRKK
jgi:hypothetical protein